MNTLEELDKEYAEKRAKLEREQKLAHALPTNGKSITWAGENGWDNKGAPLPPTEKTCPLLPWIIHNDTAYKAARHVSYKAPDSQKWTNGQGEHVSSQYRAGFVRQYLLAIVEAYAPFIIDLVAVKGSRYGAYFPEGFDYKKLRDYTDAEEVTRGLCEVNVSSGVGERGHTSGHLEFYVQLPEIGIVKVDITDAPGMHAVAPRAHGVRRYGGEGPVASVDSWKRPTLPLAPAHVRQYGSGDHRRLSASLHYLFHSVNEALECLGILQKGDY